MQWITANGNQVGAVVLLMIAVFAGYKGWIVPGWLYKQVEQERDDAIEELKKQNTALADIIAFIKSKPPEGNP